VRVATQGSPYPKPKQKPHSLILLGRAPVVEVCNGYLAAARAVARRRHTAIAAGRDPTVVDSTARPGREQPSLRQCKLQRNISLHCNTEAAAGSSTIHRVVATNGKSS
jgi:hypothetical protein